jgi:DNA end-binding protein Ku
MAEQLIESMTTEWKPEQYTDEYRDALENLIEEKIEHGDKAAPAPPKKKRPSNVVDLVSILQESIQQSQGMAKASGTRTQPKSRRANRRKKERLNATMRPPTRPRRPDRFAPLNGRACKQRTRPLESRIRWIPDTTFRRGP